MVNGFFDVENRLDYLTANGDILPTLKNLIPWEDFRSDLEAIYAHERKSNTGRRPFDVVMLFKILILQSLYNLSDDEMEYQIMDRLSFMRFLGLDLDSRVPDAKTIWLFRSKLEMFHLTRKLFDKFSAFLASSGFEARKGQIVDATIVRVPIQRNTRKENEAIKEGKPPVENWSEAKKCQKDTDARWTYRSAEHEAELKALKFRAHLQRKGCRGRPLTSWEKQGNRTRSKTRSRIEHVFGAMVQRAGNVILRTIGIKAAEMKLGLRNLAYNMDRYCTLMLQTA